SPVFARIFNVIGAGLDERHAAARFASQAVAIRDSTGVPIKAGNLSTTRDFIDVRDVASALILLSSNGQPYMAYNVASGQETSMEAILNAIVRACEIDEGITVERSYAREADIDRVVADISRLRMLGYEPAYGLQQSIDALVEYYRDVVRLAK
ncbi:MAG: GDP-mannose 4,6-dehydratase, partial [Candidatus Eremiobacteraeota bacterium]|nr:GDP-mannose 4,6-dehydratase [Candidatus Eremiobacteraeota bacterium]